MGKVELKLQHFDDWMLRWRHFQTKDDLQIELDDQCRRQRNYFITGAVGSTIGLYTTSYGTINRIFGLPHFFDNGIDGAIKDGLKGHLNSMRRFTPTGFARILTIGVPVFFTISILDHMSQQSRYKAYLNVQTVFGEQARRFHKNGKIEEFLAVNIKANLPAEEAAIYSK